MKKSMNPIHQDEDGKWYFWNETWADRLGPYDSIEKADEILTEYCRYLDEGPRINIKWEN